MKRLFPYLFMVLCLGLMFNASVMAETKWITKNNSTTSKVKTIEQLYVDNLLTRGECIKTKKKILKGQSVPGCKIIKTEENQKYDNSILKNNPYSPEARPSCKGWVEEVIVCCLCFPTIPRSLPEMLGVGCINNYIVLFFLIRAPFPARQQGEWV